jgi:uncharacterized protein YjeT (DUF2065 family)
VTPDRARVALGIIRVTNGLLALAAPTMFMRRLGITPGTNPAATYALRMFGVRTIFLGLDLLGSDGAGRLRALDRAPAIHAVDAVSALAAGVGRQLPLRGAITAAAVSAVNLGLAVIARRAARPA